MNFALYKPTNLETLITNQYQNNGIYSSSELDIFHIANIFGVDIRYYSGRPFVHWNENHAVIFLNIDDSEEDNREYFFHEICHILRHCGDQRKMPELFRALQEAQASHFQLYASIPFYLLRDSREFQYKMDYILYIQQEFKVSFDLAKTRFEQIERRLFQAALDHSYKRSIYYTGGWYRIYY